MRKINFTNKVYLNKCKNYDEAPYVVTEMIEKIAADNGFENDYSGKKVLIKPNLLAKKTPESVVTTNPQIVMAAAKFFKERGAHVTIADSPGGPYQLTLLNSIYRASQMDEAAKKSGAELNQDLGHQSVPYHDGQMTKVFNIINPVADADIVVNVCRMKTHALCEMTAAVKNMFGTIPGLQKAEQHARFPQKTDFANLLIDLCLCTAPQINITDAVLAMEGNGPASGKIKKVGAIIGSADPFASDLLTSHLMGYNPTEVGTVCESIKRGFCPDDISKLCIIGENPEHYTSKFKRPDSNAGGLLKQLPNVFGGRLQKALEPRPVVILKKCIGCGECARCCPQETIEMANKKAFIIKDKCIKCYCCQELCPQKAIKVKRNIFIKIPDMVSKK